VSSDPERVERDQPHDILAAEEFGVPAPSSDVHADEPHDVLAAEEFEMGAADLALHHGPLQIPDDLSGSAEPHDVLAAEEFPVPAGRRGHRHDQRDGVAVRGARARLALILAGLGVAAAIVRRRRPSQV
jgi:hypothetical protein